MIATYPETAIAEETTRRLHGVTGVADELEVRLSGDHQGGGADIAAEAIKLGDHRDINGFETVQ